MRASGKEVVGFMFPTTEDPELTVNQHEPVFKRQCRERGILVPEILYREGQPKILMDPRIYNDLELTMRGLK